MRPGIITGGQLMQLEIFMKGFEDTSDHSGKTAWDNRVSYDQDFLHDDKPGTEPLAVASG